MTDALLRHWRAPGAVAAAMLAAAAWLRFQLVEPAALSGHCSSSGSGDMACLLRALAVSVFEQQRIGIAALVLATAALLSGHRPAALAALALAAAGLVLYSADASAPAALLALAAWSPAAKGAIR